MATAVWCSALVVLLLFTAAAALTTDGLALLAFKAAVSADPTGALDGWRDDDADPCKWRGVKCGAGGHVTALSLPGRALRGYLPSELSLLSALRSLSLPRNRLQGPIPQAISALGNLTALDLSHNFLSGPIPENLSAIGNLTVLDLSGNLLSGPIPLALGDLTALSHLDLSSNLLNGSLPAELATLPQLQGVLNLSSNRLSGGIPPEYGGIPVTVSLDLRRNNLSGEIPQVGSLLNQGPTAFAENPDLCGFPLKTPCADSKPDPRVPRINPNFTASPSPPVEREEGRKGRPGFAVPVLAAVVLAAVASVGALQWQLRRRRAAEKGKKGVVGKGLGGAAAEGGERRGGGGEEVYVAVDEGFGVELEELLRASAYVVGKSRGGIVYRVVVGGPRGGGVGGVLAVRRLSEGEEGEGEVEEWRRRRGFEAEAMAIGRAQHQNVVQLRAYYYAPDERLLIYDYIPNGTLHSALHGESLHPTGSGSLSPLPWAARLAIIQGAARGLAYLHECSPRKYIHGNIKTSKILLDDDLHPYISGFGLTRLISATARKLSHSVSKKLIPCHLAADSSNGAYLAPEVRVPGSLLTQKCDVYSFGIVLLEVLTGRLPGVRPEHENMELEGFVRRAFKEERPLSEVVDPALLHEVYAKKQVLSVFHVALGCTDPDPDMRPRMRTVSESLDRIGVPQ